LSVSTTARLKEEWKTDLARFQGRDLPIKCYGYLWAEGIYFNVRLEGAKRCILVIIGVGEKSGQQEVGGILNGCWGREQYCRELFLKLKRQGLTAPPQLAVDDKALRFLKALWRYTALSPATLLGA
jgi:transposase-like protein